MYDTVLVPTDGGDHAIRAAQHADAVARAFDATVHVVSAVDVQGAGGAFDVGGVTDEFVDQLEAQARGAIEATVDGIGVDDGSEGGADGPGAERGGEDGRDGGSGRIRTAVVRGSPAGATLDYADEHGVDLVAMGTHGRTGVERLVAGSVTERVLRRSPVPVLTARAVDRPASGGYDEVLVPTDGSDAADAAVDHALALAEAFDARVHAVTVVEVGPVAIDASTSTSPEVIAHLESAGEEAVESVANRARAAGLDAVTEVRVGSPGRGILDYADEHGIDLVAMGTHGRSGLERLVLGSTTERVVRHADCPVVSVRPDETSAE